jgi:hypothetical protein
MARAKKQTITLNHKYVTPQAYAKLSGLSYDTVLYMCKSKQIKAVCSEGGFWKVAVSLSEFANQEEYEKLLVENARLRTLLGNIETSLGGVITLFGKGA